MPFFTQDILKLYLPASQVDAMADRYAEEFAASLTAVDKIITAKSGIQPPATANAATNPDVLLYGSYLVRAAWLPWVSAEGEALGHVTANRDLAIKELESMRGVPHDADYAVPDVTYTTTKRLGEMI